MRISTLALAAILAGSAVAPLSAQFLRSQSLAYSGGRMVINLTLRQGSPSTVYTVAVTGATTFIISSPATVTSDSRGYASVVLDVQCLSANSNPDDFTVTLTGGGGPLSRSYLLKCVNNVVASAWPEYMMVQGAFCNPVTDSSSHLQIDRTVDLDGDGVYGDLIREGLGRDPLDFPSEFTMDVNGQGTNGCDGGSPGGLFLPGGAARQVAFFADNRVWGGTGTCDWTTAMNFLQDCSATTSFNGGPALFATSSGGDNVLIGRDANNDGVMGASEISVFFDPNVLVNAEAYSPDGVAVDPSAANRVFWISDKAGAAGSPTNQGLFRLTDGNADNAIGAGEFVASWTGTSGVVVVEGQNVDHTEFECVDVDPVGGVLVNQTADGTIYRWVDTNANGVAETGEVSNWLTYNTASALTVNVDFANNINFPAFPGPYFGLNLIESVSVGGSVVTFVGSTDFAGPTSGFIFRCQDGNADGDVNDMNEVTFFSDATQSSSLFGTSPNGMGGMDVATVDVNGDGTITNNEVFVHTVSGNGPTPSCGYTFGDAVNWRMVDLNGDGDALDGAAEADVISVHPTGVFNRGIELVPGPVDGGFNHSFYSRSSFMTVQSANCVTATSGDYLELDFKAEKLEEGTQGTPFAGNSRFTIKTSGAAGMAATAVIFAVGEQVPPFPFGSCTVGLVPPFFASIPAKVPDVAGNADFPLSIPAGISGTLYFQVLALDPTIVFYFGEVNEMRIQ